MFLRSNPTPQQTNIGGIVGGVIIAVLTVAACVGWALILHRRRKRSITVARPRPWVPPSHNHSTEKLDITASVNPIEHIQRIAWRLETEIRELRDNQRLNTRSDYPAQGETGNRARVSQHSEAPPSYRSLDPH